MEKAPGVFLGLNKLTPPYLLMHYSLVKNRASSSLRKVVFEVCGFSLVGNFEHVVSADNHKMAAYGN